MFVGRKGRLIAVPEQRRLGLQAKGLGKFQEWFSGQESRGPMGGGEVSRNQIERTWGPRGRVEDNGNFEGV